MGKVIAGITTSLDGYVTGPDGGPGCGLGRGGERLHYWVFGGPWSYDAEPTGEIMGGADVIRQALAAGVVHDLSVIVAPVVLGGGKHLFDGFEHDIDLEHAGVRQSPYATFIDYEVRRS